MTLKIAKGLLALVVIGCAVAIVKVLPTSKSKSLKPLPAEVNKANAAAEISKSHQHQNVENKTARSIALTGTIDEKSKLPTPGGAKSGSSSKSIERWTLIMKENSLPLISSGSLRLTEAATALMELSPEQEQSVNLAIERFLDRLRAEEIAHAYVSADPNGNEQIVVRPFDRTETIKAFRHELQAAGGPEVAQFLGEQAAFSPALAAGNWEMRAYVEHTSDGKDMDVFVRTRDTPVYTGSVRNLPPQERVISKTSLGSQTRIRHLFAAMDQLPRESMPLPKSAGASNPKK